VDGAFGLIAISNVIVSHSFIKTFNCTAEVTTNRTQSLCSEQ
jgi:hypothetical protein